MLPLEGISLGPLLPEHPEELLVGIALFLIVWFVVAKKVVPMFEKTYEERTAAIAGGIEKAEKAQLEAARLRRYITELEATQRELKATAAELTSALETELAPMSCTGLLAN